MHKMTVRSSERFALLENSDFIAHAAIAQFSHIKARFNGVRKSDRREILATGFDNQADDGDIMHIKHALFHQVAVPSRIEIRVIGVIIYVSIYFVNNPTGGDRFENFDFRSVTGLEFEKE